MNNPWKTTNAQRLAFAAGPFVGETAAAGAGPILALSQPIDGLTLAGDLTLRYRMESSPSVAACKPRLETGYIQQPYAVLPYAVETPAGLRLTAFVRASADGVDVDVRLATVETLDEVSLSAELSWTNATHRPLAIPTDIRARTRASAGVALGWLAANDRELLSMTDVGERGRTLSHANGLGLEFFGQSLEKGVILVGRIAFRSATDDASALAALAEWLEHPKASL